MYLASFALTDSNLAFISSGSVAARPPGAPPAAEPSPASTEEEPSPTKTEPSSQPLSLSAWASAAPSLERIATQQPSSNAALQALLKSMVSAHVVTTYINTVAGYEDSIDPSVLLMFATKLACAVINGAVVLKRSNYAAPVRFCLHPTPE